tara:strand:- start:13 stop:714 length:702 start_codon:yes stop_codon:yes gene_type:complete
MNTGIFGPGINPFPIYSDGDGGDDRPTGPGRTDYGYKGPGSSKGTFNIEDIGEGTIDDEDIIDAINLNRMDLVRAGGAYLVGGPLSAANSLRKSNNRNRQAEIDRINREINLDYGKFGGIGAREAQRRQDEAGGSVQSSDDYSSSGGQGDQGATGANFSGDFATDSASYDLADGGRVGYRDGGLTEYEVFKLGELGYNTKGGTVLEPFGGIKVLKDILRVNKYAYGGIVGMYR